MPKNLNLKLEKEVEKVVNEIENCIPMKLIGTRNAPDRCIVLPGGRMLFIEFKRPGGRLRPGQKEWEKSLKIMGHNYLLSDNANDVLAEIDRIKEEIEYEENQTRFGGADPLIRGPF